MPSPDPTLLLCERWPPLAAGVPGAAMAAMPAFEAIEQRAATPQTDGLAPEDVAWLLERDACEILGLRPGAATRPVPVAA